MRIYGASAYYTCVRIGVACVRTPPDFIALHVKGSDSYAMNMDRCTFGSTLSPGG